MKKILLKNGTFIRLLRFTSLISFAYLLNSCADRYLENNRPPWLGANIYDQLKQGYTLSTGEHLTFSNYLRLIDDLNYSEVLRKTGSKTVFAFSDEAFTRFFASNLWGVTSYDGLSLSQKKYLMNGSMINNPYLIELLSKVEGPIEGQAMRRLSAVSPLDSVTLESVEKFPSNSHWKFRRDQGKEIYLMKDNYPAPMVHFTQSQMDFKGISDNDFSILFNGQTRQKNDAHIYGDKVIARDITCQNGYIHILQDVLVTPSNMAEVIRGIPDTKVFSTILERFAAPYPDVSAMRSYKLIHPDFKDSIFVKRYFAENTGLTYFASSTPDVLESSYSSTKDPSGSTIPATLEFDPGWNMYTSPSTSHTTSPIQVDMGTMFVPTDDVINHFFNQGAGKFLIQKYGSIEGIPDDKIYLLVRNLMKPSFIGSVPSKFDQITDDSQAPMGLTKNDEPTSDDPGHHVKKSYVANNGAVYVIDKVFAPASYVAVTAPVLVSDNTKIFNWAIKNCPTLDTRFEYYLLSMDSRYSLLVPDDRTPDLSNQKGIRGLYYLDPVSVAKAKPQMWRFWEHVSNNAVDAVYATSYDYDLATNTFGTDSVRYDNNSAIDKVKNRLSDMLDYHIVVNDDVHQTIESGKLYYRTKGNGEIKVNGLGENNMQVLGGGNIERGSAPLVTKIYDQTRETNAKGNGKTYFIDSPLLPSYKSLYKVLSEHPEYSKFFELLQGGDEYDQHEIDYHIAPLDKPLKDYVKKYNVFEAGGLDYVVKFFNTFHYTVYIPTNDAIDAAVANGLPTWDYINSLPSNPDSKTSTGHDPREVVKDSLADVLITFIRYHFQDNSVYIDGTSSTSAYETAAFSKGDPANGIPKSYYKVFTRLTPDGLTLSNSLTGLSSSNAVSVLNNNLTNAMVREYTFDVKDPKKATSLVTSSYAVLQPINKVLVYDNNLLSGLKKLVKNTFGANNNKINKKK